MIGQGYPLTVQDRGRLWWYVIGWTGGDAALSPVVVPLGLCDVTRAEPRIMDVNEIRAWDADPDGLAPVDSGD